MTRITRETVTRPHNLQMIDITRHLVTVRPAAIACDYCDTLARAGRSTFGEWDRIRTATRDALGPDRLAWLEEYPDGTRILEAVADPCWRYRNPAPGSFRHETPPPVMFPAMTKARAA